MKKTTLLAITVIEVYANYRACLPLMHTDQSTVESTTKIAQ